MQSNGFMYEISVKTRMIHIEVRRQMTLMRSKASSLKSRAFTLYVSPADVDMQNTKKLSLAVAFMV